MNFNQPITTTAGKKYTVSLYSLVNCGNTRCSRAIDSLTIQIKDGDNGVFQNVYTIANHTVDSHWYYYSIDYTAISSSIFVRS